MANGFQYESPLNRLLGITIPKFVEGQLEREHKERISDREFTYREEQNILNRQREDESLKLATKRYDDSIIEAEDDELYARGKFKIEQFNSERNLKKKHAMFSGLESTDLHPEILSLATSSRIGLETQIEDVETMMDEFPSDLYSVRELARIRNQGMLGNVEGMHQVGDKIFSDRYTTPWVKTESKRILGEIKDTNTEIKTLGGLMTDDAKLRRTKLEGDKITLRGQLADLYDKDRPFDPIAEGQKFSKGLQDQLKASGLEIKDKEAGAAIAGKYIQEISAFKQEYLTGSNRNNYTAAQRDSASQKLINGIIAKEKIEKPILKPEGEWPNLIPSVGTLGSAYVGWQMTQKPRKFIADKIGQAAKYTKWVTKLPNEDIGKFLETVSKKTPGQVGTMMPKVEKLISKIDEATLGGEKGYKKEVTKLNAELDKQVNKIKKTLRKTKGVSSKIKDADLEKLIRNPNKWFLPKVKTKMFSLAASSGKMARAWGSFRIAQEVGKALGDETGGVATGLGAAGSWKLAKKIYKKKGPKWMAQRLTPVIGKALTKRVMQGAVSGTIIPGWGNVAGTVLGAGIAARDVAEALGMIGQEIEAEEEVISSIATRRDSTQAPIDSTLMRRNTTGIARPFNPADPDSGLFNTPAR